MDNIEMLTMIFAIILGIMLILLMVLAFIFISSKSKKKKIQVTNNNNNIDIEDTKVKKFVEYRTESVMDFLEFDTVVDNMISQKDGMRYIMVVECQGINYDLMSEVEKNSVEEGFIQFLNTIRYPIQIYTQTRSINLDNSINTYKEKVKELQIELEKYENHYREMERSGKYSDEEMKKQFFELTKKRNLYEYGKDIIFNTERMSLNKNVLNKKYYVVVPYFIEETSEINNYDKEEERNFAFSELYTRAQSVIRTLAVCGINSKVMTSNELVELLYMAYNRDEAEVYGIDKALKAGYDELYTTAPDVIDKQIKALDKEIEEKALEEAKDVVTKVKTDKSKKLSEKQENKKDLIDQLAKMIIEENSKIIGEDVAQEAIQKIDNKKNKKEKGGIVEDAKEQKTKRGRKPKTA